MSTPEPISRMREQERTDGGSKDPVEALSPGRRPAVHRREKRWEIGFFIRKIVNGWLTFYKQYPPSRFKTGRDGRTLIPVYDAPPAGEAPQALAMHAAAAPAGAEDDPIGDPSELGGPPMGNGDGGPVGSTRYEAGLVLRSVTETTDGSDES